MVLPLVSGEIHEIFMQIDSFCLAHAGWCNGQRDCQVKRVSSLVHCVEPIKVKKKIHPKQLVCATMLLAY